MAHSLKKILPLFLIVVFSVGFLACETDPDLGLSKNKSVASADPSAQTSSPDVQTTPRNSQSQTSPPVSPVEGKLLRWSVPQKYVDGTILDPKKDLQGYEIFVKRSSKTFSANDEPAILLSATENGNLIQSFRLTDLDYTFYTSQTYYFSIRSVAKSGLVSTFSTVSELRI